MKENQDRATAVSRNVLTRCKSVSGQTEINLECKKSK